MCLIKFLTGAVILILPIISTNVVEATYPNDGDCNTLGSVDGSTGRLKNEMDRVISNLSSLLVETTEFLERVTPDWEPEENIGRSLRDFGFSSLQDCDEENGLAELDYIQELLRIGIAGFIQMREDLNVLAQDQSSTFVQHRRHVAQNHGYLRNLYEQTHCFLHQTDVWDEEKFTIEQAREYDSNPLPTATFNHESRNQLHYRNKHFVLEIKSLLYHALDIMTRCNEEGGHLVIEKRALLERILEKRAQEILLDEEEGLELAEPSKRASMKAFHWPDETKRGRGSSDQQTAEELRRAWENLYGKADPVSSYWS